MKINIIIGLILSFGLILGFSQITKAQKSNNINVVQPQTTFDFKLAADMINTGTSQIKGKALLENRAPIGRKISPDTYVRRGETVTLYPLTPYFAEFLELRKQDKKNKQIAAISREANSFRLLTKVYNDEGEFLFLGLKPGKYFLESFAHFSSGIGGHEINGIVEIKTDGEIVTFTLKEKYQSKHSRF